MPEDEYKTRISKEVHESLTRASKLTGLTMSQLVDKYVIAEKANDFTKILSHDLLQERYQLMLEAIEKTESQSKRTSQPDPSVIDAAILIIWVYYPKQWIKTRKEIIEAVRMKMQYGYYPDKETMAPPLTPTSIKNTWGRVYRSWFKNNKQTKSKFENYVDNRVKSLIEAKILTNAGRGKYQLIRDFDTADKDIIFGVNRISPQKGIKIPTLLAHTMEESRRG
jgi:hypothetical protein